MCSSDLSALAIAMFPLVIFSSVVTGQSTQALSTLSLSVLGIILGSILLSTRSLIILAFVNLIGILVIPIVSPQFLSNPASIATPAASLVIATFLALVFIRQRERIENLHQSELQDSKERLDLALEASNLGTWDWNIESGAVKWSDNVESIFGLGRGEFKIGRAHV